MEFKEKTGWAERLKNQR